MLAIDLTGKRALVAGVSDDGGFGFAIAKALAEAGASICVGSWPPALGIFTKLLERGQDGRVDAAERRRASSSSSGSTRSTRPSTPWPRRRPRSARTSGTRSRATSASQGMTERIRQDFGDGALDIVVHSLANGARGEVAAGGHEPRGLSRRGRRERLQQRQPGAAPRAPHAAERRVPVADLHGGRAGDSGLRRRDVVAPRRRSRRTRGRSRSRPAAGGACASTPSRPAPGPRARPRRSASSTR